MKLRGLQEYSSEPASITLLFVDTLETLIYSEKIIIDGYAGIDDHTKVRSAKAVHEKTIGKLSGDHLSFYLFPDLLIEQLKKQNPWTHFPSIFEKKEELRKMLIQGGLITRRIDGDFENHVQYNNFLVEAWPINIIEFQKRSVDAEDE